MLSKAIHEKTGQLRMADLFVGERTSYIRCTVCGADAYVGAETHDTRGRLVSWRIRTCECGNPGQTFDRYTMEGAPAGAKEAKIAALQQKLDDGELRIVRGRLVRC